MTDQGEARVQEVPMPLNLATSEAQVATIQQPQTIQVQGYRKLAQASPVGGGLITKKVIIATINMFAALIKESPSCSLKTGSSRRIKAKRLMKLRCVGSVIAIANARSW